MAGMGHSKIIFSLDALNDLLFGFKHSIRATNIQFDQNHQTVHMWVEGEDVPDAPRIKIDYDAIHGRALDPKRKTPYKRPIKNPVREVRLSKIYPAK